jgi:hypothetical protein
MKRCLPLLILVLLALSSLACMTASRVLFGEPPTPAPSPTSIPPTVTPLPPTATAAPTASPTPSPTPDTCPNGDCITSCLDNLTDITRSGGTDSKSARKYFVADDEYNLVTYTVQGDLIENPVDKPNLPKNFREYQNDRTAQEKIWNYFAAIIPPENRKFLTEYIIFTDGKDNLLASVEQSRHSPSEWALSVDIMDASNPQDLTFTLVHEYGHLLTLNPSQVVPSQPIFDNPESDSVYQKEVAACQAYFPGEGCSHKDSYINLFFDRFWPKIYPEWERLDYIEDEDEYYYALEKFYEKYQDQFVTDYAPTDPAEDIAESFSFFILKPKPTGDTIADQKVLFFYDFPELVQLRDQMGRRLCAQLEK